MIDCHFHVWDISKDYYRWLTPDLDELYHTFSIEDYKNNAAPFQIKAAIVVQAADDIKESISLLKTAEENHIVQGVIGWIDFESKNSLDDIKYLSKYSHFKGVRPMLQDIEDVDWINNPEFKKIFEALVEHNLIFEALVRKEHLKNIINIAKQYPDLQIVLNHGAKPTINENFDEEEFNKWATLMKELSSYENVTCKLSGLVTECTNGYSKELLMPYVKTIIDSFTPQRVIWGSDWPVVKLKCSYEEWVTLSKDLLSYLNKDEQNNIFENNAKKLYNIDTSEKLK